MSRASRRGSFRAALAQRDFRLLLVSLAVSTMGDWFYSVALVVYVFNKTHSPAWIAAATIGRLVPNVIFGPFAGELADRVDRRKLMVAADVLRASLMAALAIVSSLGIGPGFAIALAFACATAGAPYVPAVTAMTPTLVPEQTLAAANALSGTVNYLALVVGPALGALALVFGSPAAAFAVNAVTFASSALAVSLVKGRAIRRVPNPDRSVMRRTLEGIVPIFRSSETAVLVAFFAGQALIYGLESVLLVLAAQSLMGMGVSGYGWLLSSIGVGGLIAALFGGRASEVRTPTLLLAASVFAVGLPLASLSIVTHPAVACILLPLDGAGTLLTEVIAITALQRSLREDVLGRVFASMDALAFAAVIAGSVLAPALVSWFGLKTALVIAGTCGPAATIVVSPLLRNVNRVARERIAALAPRVEVLARSHIFAGAPRSSLEMLAASLTEISVDPSDCLVREGEDAREFYVIAEGRCEVFAGEAEKLKWSLGPGDNFGEMGILSGAPRNATVRAVTTCKLYRIDAADFLGVINKSPTVHGALVNLAAARHRASLQ